MKGIHQPATLAFVLSACLFLSLPNSPARNLEKQSPKFPPSGAKSCASSKSPAASSIAETQELQKAIETSGNDRAALVRNLEDFLKKYPESQHRPQIYRALVEASLQLGDSARAANYAERIVALSPEDISMTVLAIQLLERNGDEAALRRARNYCTRILDFVQRNGLEDKSPKISREEWEARQKRDEQHILILRGKLALRLHDPAAAERDFRASVALSPSSPAEEQLGEIAELNKDWPRAIREYARAFALADTLGVANRLEIRQKLGNVWRFAHGSEQGLGDYLLHTYDEVLASSDPPKPSRNATAKAPYDFILRNAQNGSPVPLAPLRGKILVVSFWATWCGPCRAMEPHFERVAAQFLGIPEVVFLSADCDEDESLVPPYLAEEKPQTLVVFADGLDRLLSVNAFPTVVVLDGHGTIAYRAEGFDPENEETALTSAVRRLLAGPQEGAAKPDSH